MSFLPDTSIQSRNPGTVAEPLKRENPPLALLPNGSRWSYVRSGLQVLTRESRSNLRFPIRVPVKYIIGGHEGFTVTRDMSSHGVFIEGARILRAGNAVELSLNWPAVLDGHGLRLEVIGKVLRCSREGVALRIAKYEFRVRGLPHSSG